MSLRTCAGEEAGCADCRGLHDGGHLLGSLQALLLISSELCHDTQCTILTCVVKRSQSVTRGMQKCPFAKVTLLSSAKSGTPAKAGAFSPRASTHLVPWLCSTCVAPAWYCSLRPRGLCVSQTLHTVRPGTRTPLSARVSHVFPPGAHPPRRLHPEHTHTTAAQW